MLDAAWQLLFADDEDEICDQVKDYLDGAAPVTGNDGCIAVETLTDFDRVIDKLEDRHIDLEVWPESHWPGFTLR